MVSMAVVGCTAVTPAPSKSTVCEPTIAHMRPPDAAADFFANGSRPPVAREVVLAENWFGNEAMWVILPPTGEIVGRLDDKLPPYRIKRGRVQYEARQLDGQGVVSRRPITDIDYGDISFEPGGPAFPSTGCWSVTYVLDGQYPLEFVVHVR
jgi:hypothetical protein